MLIFLSVELIVILRILPWLLTKPLSLFLHSPLPSFAVYYSEPFPFSFLKIQGGLEVWVQFWKPSQLNSECLGLVWPGHHSLPLPHNV